MGPLGPTVMVDVFVSIGHPVPVVRTSGDLSRIQQTFQIIIKPF